jgi:hypothetical protein
MGVYLGGLRRRRLARISSLPNDMDANYLYRNKHDGTVEDVGMVTGVALSSSGLEMGNMAGDFGDYAHRGKFDLLITSLW